MAERRDRRFVDAYIELSVRWRPRSSCWDDWPGHIHMHGYPRWGGRNVGAIALELDGHAEPDISHPVVRHVAIGRGCVGPGCWNPDHLAWGDQRDNGDDMMRDRGGRPVVRGSQVGLAKLTEEDVREIRRWYATGGVTQTEIAEHYGVNNSNVSRAITGKNWSHVD